jgi:hypothetical protein
MKSKKLIKRIIIITISVILAAFIAFNIVWFSYYNYVMDNFIEKVNKKESGGEITYQTVTDTYSFSVYPPTYLHFNTSLNVRRNNKNSDNVSSDGSISSDEKTNNTPLVKTGTSSLLVWIPFNREPYYSANILEKNSKTNNLKYYSYYIDKDINLIPGRENQKYSEEEVKIFESNKASAAEVLELAKSQWPELL